MNDIYIIILNWNGWEDTIECLDSILKSNLSNMRVILLDNGSTDSSIENINKWILIKKVAAIRYDKIEAEQGGTIEKEKELINSKSEFKIVLIENKSNLGFAIGNNVGINYSVKQNSKYTLLLNNDTVVESDAIKKLSSFLDNKNDYDILTPQIRYYKPNTNIWNCGGRLKWYGARKYLYANDNVSKVPQSGIKNITFITGCALFARTNIFKEHSNLSEKFFFGEEDFEFSLRMKRSKIKIACLFESVIYHKVGVSIKKADSNKYGKLYIYYLNRFIDLRDFWPYSIWLVWRFFYLGYMFVLFCIKQNMTILTFIKFINKLFKESKELNGVNKKKFDDILINGF